MNETDWIARLARTADAAGPAETDVAARVTATLRARPSRGDTRVWAGAAAAGCVAAVLMTLLAAGEWSSLDNPLTELSPPDVATGTQ